MLSENMASLGGDELLTTKTITVDTVASQQQEDIRKPKDREDRLRYIKDRQNEERQRKLEELKAQAIAAQKYREQKEEERKRRIDDLRCKEMDRKQQVDERKKAILDAERDRRDYILRKNQERDSRIETKKRNERSQIAFAFGSSTPRLLDPVDVAAVSSSPYWGHRRSTSITNVAFSGVPLTRRSSERELSDTPKKRATSAGGLDRQNEDRKMSTSMYEVFNWGNLNDARPKRYTLAIAGSEINIDEPPSHKNHNINNYNYKMDESTDSSPISYRSVARRKTDLMPTVPSPREYSFGSRSSLYCHTPRTPGRAVSMTRLDQLAQPTRRNGEHIRAVIERQRQRQIDSMSNSATNSFSHTPNTNARSMSRSMTHLAGSNNTSTPNQKKHSAGSPFRQLTKTDASKSMSQLLASKLSSTRTNKTLLKKQSKNNDADAPAENLSATASRSGDVTPGASRPGSALSTSTSASGVVYRRSITNSARKPRPSSIAGTGMTVENDKQKRDKPPLPRVQSSVRKSLNTSNNSSAPATTTTTSAVAAKQNENTPKRSEKRTTVKKATTPRTISPAPSKIHPEAVLVQEIQQSVDTKIDTNQQLISMEAPIEIKEIVNNSTDTVHEVVNEIQTVTTTTTTTVEETDRNNSDVVVAPIVPVQAAEQQAQEPVVELSANTAEVVEKIVEQKIDEKIDVVNKKIENLTIEDTESTDLVSAIRETTAVEVVETKENEMTASMIAKRITTEDEAKAALAERRRLAREEAERNVEIERQRIEAEELAEEKRIAEEEEQQRRFEEETLRLAEEQKKAEELRLLQAIQEAKLREEEERQRKEDEEKLRVEREESEKKAREEAEKQKVEVAERLKKEEKEREERRKRVEAIMSRTRKGTPGNTPNKNDEKDAGKQNENISPSNSDSNLVRTENNDLANSVTSVKENIESNINDYEKSVTEREHALINSLIGNNKISAQIEQDLNTQNLKTNGKIIDFDLPNDDKLIIKSAISNGNGHTDHSLDNKIESTLGVTNFNNEIDNKLQETLTGQLIDINNIDSDHQTAEPVNFNNNSLLTSGNLVTSDSHENKEISLL